MTRLKIYAAGFNSHGQLGVGEEGNDKHTFTECMLEPDVDIEDFETLQVKICSGAVHTLLLISHDGKKDLYMAGCSKKGQLGMITQTNMRRFTLRSTEDILHQVDPLHQPRIPGYIRQPQDIAAGWETSFILFSDPGQNDTERNSLAMLGSNEYRQLMSADKNVTAKVYRNYNRIIVVKQIVSGPLHTMMIGDNGQIRGWGFNCSQISPSVPPRANAIMTVPINMHFQLGPDDLAEETIALGIRHTCIVAPQQPYALFGDNTKGQIGSIARQRRRSVYHHVQSPLGADLGVNRKVFANWNSTFLLCSNGCDLHSLGDNSTGQLGRFSTFAGDRGRVEFPEDITVFRNVEVAAGAEHTLAVLEVEEERRIYGWGWGEHGNFGKGSDNLEDVRIPERIQQPCDGRIHSIHAGNGTSWVAMIVD